MVNSRRKGHQYEREICTLLRPVYPDCERTQEGDSLDRAGVDIRGTGGLLVQCKRGRGYASARVLKEITVSGGVPVVITRADNERSVAMLYADDLIRILEDIGVAYETRDTI